MLRQNQAVQQMLQCLQQGVVVPCLPFQPVVARLDRRYVLPATPSPITPALRGRSMHDMLGDPP